MKTINYPKNIDVLINSCCLLIYCSTTKRIVLFEREIGTENIALIAGGREINEDPADTALLEATEEAGVKLTRDQLITVITVGGEKLPLYELQLNPETNKYTAYFYVVTENEFPLATHAIIDPSTNKPEGRAFWGDPILLLGENCIYRKGNADTLIFFAKESGYDILSTNLELSNKIKALKMVWSKTPYHI